MPGDATTTSGANNATGSMQDLNKYHSQTRISPKQANACICTYMPDAKAAEAEGLGGRVGYIACRSSLASHGCCWRPPCLNPNPRRCLELLVHAAPAGTGLLIHMPARPPSSPASQNGSVSALKEQRNRNLTHQPLLRAPASVHAQDYRHPRIQHTRRNNTHESRPYVMQREAQPRGR